MIAQTTPQESVGQLLIQAAQLQPNEFDQFVVRVLALRASRRADGLSVEESALLKKINLQFSPKKMERFMVLDEKRQNEALK